MTSQSRRYLLILSLLMGMVTPEVTMAEAPISNTSSGSVADRITTLERISNAQSVLLTQIQQQLADNQSDIDMLRGNIQENQYQLNQVVERQKQLYQQMNSMTVGSTTTGEATILEKTSTPSTSIQVIENKTSGSGDGSREYNNAVSLVLEKKENEQAITAFQDFIKKYPESVYQSNANYWLGQLLYNKGQKEDASYYFAIVVKNYPKSPKASDAMLKVGLIIQEKGERDKSAAVFQQVITQYPKSSAAKQAQKYLTGS